MREWQNYSLNYYNSDIFAQKYCDKGAYIFLIHGSFGDIYCSLALLKSFNDYYKININVILDVKLKQLSLKFSYPFCKYIFTDNINKLAYSLQLKNQKFILYPGLIYPTLPTCHPLICEAVLTERMNDTEARRLIFGLPTKSIFDNGFTTNNDLMFVEAFFQKNKLIKNKTIIISPVTNTFKFDLLNFYKNLAISLKQLGFGILINIAMDKNNIREHFNDYICTEIEPNLVLEYSNYANYHICSFNGLYTIHTLFKNTSKFISIKDARSKIIVSNGIKINVFSASAFTVIDDVHKNNDLTELNIISDIHNAHNYIIKDWIINSQSNGLKVVKI